MGYIEGTIRKYLDDAAAKLPAPGGGSISALAGALAASMGSMSARFTLGKKKFKDVEPRIQTALDRLEACRQRLMELTDEDTVLYEKVMAAYRLPKETDAEAARRQAAVDTASKEAIGVPLEIVRQCAAVAQAAADIVDVANPNLITDLCTAACLAEAACRTGRLNVDFNLGGLSDKDFVSTVSAEVAALCAAALQARTRVDGSIHAFLNS